MERKPPYDIDAEKSVLGSLLLDNQVIDSLDGIITDTDFYHEAHKRLYGAIVKNYKKTPIDIITLSNLFDKKALENVGGVSYIAGLVDNVPSAANVTHYAKIVKEFSLRRQLLSAVYEISELAHTQTEDVADIIEKAQKEILNINPISNFESIKTAAEVARSTFKQIETRHENGGGLIGISTGLNDLDEITAGLCPGEYTIIAGRPGMGKSALAGNILKQAGLRGEAAMIASLEMPNETIMMRIFASMAKIESRQIRKGFLRENEWPKLIGAVSEISDTPMYFDDSPIVTPQELRMRARKAKKDCDIKLLILDYLQLMTTDGKNSSREREIAEISRTLKSIARELKIHVIGVSQLNRDVEKRPNKRPMMSDLRESGAIEQDADLILFIYRDEVYHTDEDNPEKGIAEIIVGKNRHGVLTTVKTTFSAQYQQFYNLEHTHQDTRYGGVND